MNLKALSNDWNKKPWKKCSLSIDKTATYQARWTMKKCLFGVTHQINKERVPHATGDQILSITEFQIVCFEAAKLVKRTNSKHHKELPILKNP